MGMLGRKGSEFCCSREGLILENSTSDPSCTMSKLLTPAPRPPLPITTPLTPSAFYLLFCTLNA